MIAEAEVSGNGRKSLGATSREDDGVVVGENVVAVILESALPAHGSESAVPVEDVVVLAAVFSLTGIVAKHIGKSRLLHPALVLLAPQVSAPVAYEGVDVRPIEGLGQARSLCVVPRLTRVLGSEGIRQTLPEALRDGVANFVKLRDPVAYLLAVRCKHIFAIGEHPVEAATAGDYVLARRIVVYSEHIVALTAGESVFHRVTVFADLAAQEVVTN